MQGQFNYLNLLQMIKNGQNPQQLILSYLENSAAGSPMAQNLLKLAKEGNTSQIEQIARNIYQQKGMDFDKEFASFRQSLNI